MERRINDDSPDRLAGDDSPARASKLAQHEDELSPAKDLRERVAASRSERVGNGTAVAGPITSPPEEPRSPAG
jgi:hypothetical protein